MNIEFKADEDYQFIPFTSSVELTGSTLSPLIDLRVMISFPLHMRHDNCTVVPLKHAIPEYRLLTGNNTNWNSLLRDNAFTVGGIDTEFVSIQSCLDVAPAGSVIIVYPGVYSESLVITKPVTLMSVGGLNDTLLTSSLTISASHVTLDGFTVSSNDEYHSLVAIDGSHLQIQNCKFSGQYFVGQSVEMQKISMAISCHNCQHVKIMNNIFSHNIFSLHVMNAKHMMVKSNIFSNSQVSIMMQVITDVHISGNLFEFNRDVVQYDTSGSSYMASFVDNVYHENLQSDVCQFEDQFDYWFVPDIFDIENCPYLNISSNSTTKTGYIMRPPDQLLYTGWCGNEIQTNYTHLLEVEEDLHSRGSCIALLGSIVATADSQGLCTFVFFQNNYYSFFFSRKLPASFISTGNTSAV